MTQPCLESPGLGYGEKRYHTLSRLANITLPLQCSFIKRVAQYILIKKEPQTFIEMSDCTFSFFLSILFISFRFCDQFIVARCVLYLAILKRGLQRMNAELHCSRKI